jgi:hypothetical protein
VIEKNHKVPNKKKNDHDEETVRYSYAAIEDLVAQAGPYLKEFGFSWTVKPEQTDTHVTAVVHLHHKSGHEEVTKFSVPIDPAAYMSDPQKAAAALTFATRYAFKGATGIQTKGEDNDAQGDGEPRRGYGKREPIREPQEAKDAAVPVAHEEVKALDDYGKILSLLKSVSTAPGGQVVAIFTEAEQIDYTYEAKEAKDSPDVLKRILSDIVQTGAKRHKSIKGTEEKGAT